MKRTLYSLITLFTFIGAQASAQQIDINIGSGSAGVGNTVDISFEVQYPPGVTYVNDFFGSIELTDPSVATIVGVSTNQFVDIVWLYPYRFVFENILLNAPPQFVSGNIITLTLEITGLGCSDIIFTDYFSSSSNYTYPAHFVLDGVLYDDLNTDFNITNGQVCGLPGIDCDFLPAPSNLDCDLVLGKFTGYQTLSWDAEPSATSYEIEIVENDTDDCCAGVTGQKTTSIISTTSTSISMPAGGRCFSWRVRSVCSDGTESPWSDKNCSCGPVQVSGPGPEKSLSQSNEIEAGQLKLMAVPNPAADHVDIVLSGSLFEENSSEMEMFIYDMSGRMAYTSNIELDKTTRVDLHSFNSGMYIINISQNGIILSTEKLIVE